MTNLPFEHLSHQRYPAHLRGVYHHFSQKHTENASVNFNISIVYNAQSKVSRFLYRGLFVSIKVHFVVNNETKLKPGPLDAPCVVFSMMFELISITR